MKKIITSLISLMVLLLLGNMPAMALMPIEQDGKVFKDPGNGYTITKENDSTYVLEAESPLPPHLSNGVNFQNMPNGNNQEEQAFMAAFKACTGKLTIKGKFSNLQAFNNNSTLFTNVDLSDLDMPTTTIYGGYYDQEAQTYVSTQKEAGFSGQYKLKDMWTNIVTLKLPDDEETFYLKDFFTNASSFMNTLKSITFGANTKVLEGDDSGSSSSIFGGIASAPNTVLTSVTLPESLEVLGGQTLKYCSGITSINLPATLTTIKPEALKGTSITELQLASLASLTRIEFEAFSYTPINSVSFPNNCQINFVGNDIFTRCDSLITLDMSMVDGIEEFGTVTTDAGTYTGIVYNCANLETVIYPPYIKVIDPTHFNACPKLETISFGPGLVEIKTGSFNNGTETSLKNIIFRTELDEALGIETSQLTKIGENGFGPTCVIESIDMSMCHKLDTISATAFSGIKKLNDVKLCSHPKTIFTNGFNECTNIKRVEVVYCAGTDVTKCVCQNQGFPYDVTCHQTVTAGAVEECARLIFTNNDASNAAMNSQCAYPTYPIQTDEAGDTIKANYNSVFDYFVGDYKTGAPISQENLNDLYKDHQPVAAGNGWWEFLNAGSPIVIPEPDDPDDKGKFLRTYSRTEGSGPVTLPEGIKAFRVLNYVASGQNEDTHLNIQGTFVLSELTATINDKEVGYVPERTGVVLISNMKAEGVLLVLNPYAGTTVLKEYPNTGDKYYDPNGTDPNQDKYEDANLLVGSFGGNPLVASVDSWDHEKGTYDKQHINFRNFGLALNEGKYVWLRLKPGGLRSNRAMAQIPSSLFNNNNESIAESPELFGAENTDIQNPFAPCIGMVFEGETTGIMVVSETNEGEGKWYNLQGMEVSQPSKGIFIRNNKKVVIK